MNIITKTIIALALVIGVFGHGAETIEARTYKVGNYTFTATHCNAQGICHDPSNAEAKNVLMYAIGAGKTTYTHNMACGNTVKLVMKSCTVSNACKDGNVVSLNSKCQRSTTACQCGCTSGACNANCGGTNDPNDPNDPDDNDDTGDNDNPGTVTTTNACPNGTSVFPSDYQGKIPSWGQKSTKTYQDCGVTPPADDGDGMPPLCPFPVGDTCPPPDITFSANPKLISKGGSCKLTWEVEGSNECIIDGEVTDDMNGTKSVSPEKTTVYKISCTNGPASASSATLCSVQDVQEQ